MSLRLVLALASSCALAITPCVGASAHADAGSLPAKGSGVVLALHLTTGNRLIEHSDLVDRIDWKLPAARLEAFKSQGVVISENVQTTIIATGLVLSAHAGIARIQGDVTTTVHDVPRNQVSTSRDRGVATVTTRNTQHGTKVYALEDAPMVDLPVTPVKLGTSWTTTQRVLTSLGSGTATFSHVVTSFEGSLVRIDVTAHGSITGKEYNLPRLLPGTIALHGTAWFDPASGLVSQESYRVDNTLLKRQGGTDIGFVEHLDADTDVHKEGRARQSNTP